jgi:magnesium chelatase family protein
MLTIAKRFPDSLQMGQSIWLGDVSPDGAILPLSGVLPIVMAAQKQGLRQAYVPAANAEEAALASGVTVYPIASLAQLLSHLRGEVPLLPFVSTRPSPSLTPGVDFATIPGHWHIKRVMEIAASGGHGLLLRGGPGVGKTQLAQAFPSLLPAMTPDEQSEVTSRYSIQGLLTLFQPIITERPFRLLTPASSLEEIIGGREMSKYGELALAHHGALLLDNLSTFKSGLLKKLRLALEQHQITYRDAENHQQVTIPLCVQLVTTMLPCPCGFFHDPEKACHCTPEKRLRYNQHIPGVLWPSLDLVVDIPRQNDLMMQTIHPEEASTQIRRRVQTAREIQWQRFVGAACSCNADMGPAAVVQYCALEKSGQMMMDTARKELSFDETGERKLLKVARTIADLAASDMIAPRHLAEAILYCGASLK